MSGRGAWGGMDAEWGGGERIYEECQLPKYTSLVTIIK